MLCDTKATKRLMPQENFARRYDNMYVLILLALILTTFALLDTVEPLKRYQDPMWWPLDMIPPVQGK